MLDQLVESNNHTKENKRRGGFLLSTFFVVCSLLASGVVWSLFAKDLGINTGNLEISMLVAPLVAADEQPKPPELQPKKEKSLAPNADVRAKIIRDINENPIETPIKISVEKSSVPPRHSDNLTVLGPDNFNAANAAAANSREVARSVGTGIGSVSGTPDGDESSTAAAAKVPPPPPFVKKEEVKPPTVHKISLGVVNGKAINLVKPPYPPVARAVHAEGAVNVQVTIDEQGNVIAANAVNGHPLLRQAAENAARASKFAPTMLSRQPVKVTGVIIYKFAAN